MTRGSLATRCYVSAGEEIGHGFFARHNSSRHICQASCVQVSLASATTKTSPGRCMNGTQANLELAQQHPLDRVLPAFLQDQPGTLAGRCDIETQVHVVDLVPDLRGSRDRLVDRQRREGVEVRVGGLKGGLTQAKEALDVPRLELLLV